MVFPLKPPFSRSLRMTRRLRPNRPVRLLPPNCHHPVAMRQSSRLAARARTNQESHGEFMVSYPLVNIQKAIENGHRNGEFSH